jgi:hypothetical protein
LTPVDIDALRQRGMSYGEIGTLHGQTKDAVRGKHTRWLRGGASVPRAAAPAKVRASGDGDRESRDPGFPPLPAVPDGPDLVGGGPRYVGFDLGYFDLEASALNGSFGRLFSAACAHVAEDDIWVARIDDPQYNNRRQPSDDSRLAVAIRDHLMTHDILVSWNGKRGYNSKGRSGFDIPMLNARLIQPGNKKVVIGRYAPKHIDLLKEIRKYIELHSFRLASVEEFLELSESKNAILPRLWNRALDGDREALDYVVNHNILDVKVLRLVFDDMRRYGLLERPSW